MLSSLSPLLNSLSFSASTERVFSLELFDAMFDDCCVMLAEVCCGMLVLVLEGLEEITGAC